MTDPNLALALSARIKPLLAGHPPEVQGAALADLLSIWLAGHHPCARKELAVLHLEYVIKLVPVSEAQIFPDGSPWQ